MTDVTVKERLPNMTKCPQKRSDSFLIINHNHFKSAPGLHGNGNVAVVGLSVATGRKDPAS